MRINRSVAASAAALLAGTTLSVVAGMASPASAACAPSTVVSPVATAVRRPHVVSSTAARKVKKKHFVATVTLTATQGSATVTVVETICPDGAVGSAVSTSQSASGVGTVTKTVTGKGSTKAAAKRAAKLKAQKAIAKIKTAAKTKRGLAAAKSRAIAAAQPQAADKAHHALYDAKITYYAFPVSADSSFTEMTAPPAGGLSLAGTSGGDLLLTIPAGAAAVESLACVRRAAAWPTNFIFDAASASSPQFSSYAHDSGNDAGVAGIAVRGLTTPAPAAPGSFVYYAEFNADGSQPSGVQSDDSPFAGDAVCFLPFVDDGAPAATVTLHGPRVGTTLGAADAAGLRHLVDGLPVTFG